MNWFDVDKQGLAAILERRGKRQVSSVREVRTNRFRR